MKVNLHLRDSACSNSPVISETLGILVNCAEGRCVRESPILYGSMQCNQPSDPSPDTGYYATSIYSGSQCGAWTGTLQIKLDTCVTVAELQVGSPGTRHVVLEQMQARAAPFASVMITCNSGGATELYFADDRCTQLLKSNPVRLDECLPQSSKSSKMSCGLGGLTSNKAMLGGIIGGVVGGLLLIGIIVFVVIFLIKRRRKNMGGHAVLQEVPDTLNINDTEFQNEEDEFNDDFM